MTRLPFRLALGLLAFAVSGDAESRSEVLNSVSALRQGSRFEDAANRLTVWIEDHPGDSDARLLLGQVLADAGRYGDAVRVWEKLLAERPDDAGRYRAVSSRMRGVGRFEEALEVLARGARRVGGDPFAWERAELSLHMGRFDEAVEAHLALLRREPNRRPLVENRIATVARTESEDGLADGGRAQGYCEALEKALARAEGRERTTLTLILANSLLETGNPRRGLEALRAAVDDSAVLQAVYPFASRCEARGYVDDAAAAYGLFAAYSNDSTYRFRSLLKQAEMRELLGDTNRAIELYTELATHYPRQREAVDALLRVARLQAVAQDSAARALETLSSLDGRTRSGGLGRRLLSLRAECYVRLDDLPSAREQLERLRADPDGAAEAAFGLARLDFYEGDFDGAVTLVDSLVARSPAHPLANDALGLLLLIEGFQAQPGALAALARARLRQRQGNVDGADKDWQWLLTEAPPSLRQLARLERAQLLETVDAARALELYSQALADAEADSRNAVSAAVGRARVLESQGEAGDALRDYERALLSAPHDSRVPEIRRQIDRLRRLLGPVSG